QTILTHVNTITGVALRDDPTIMAWETGNELTPPPEWTKLITHFIKGLDPHHLVMDGRYGIDENVLNWPDIDIYSDHFYPMNITEMQGDAVQVNQAGKVFLVGEFGWSGDQGDPLPAFLDAVRKSTAAGDLFWDLFAHGVTQGYTTPPDDSYGLVYPGTDPAMRATAQLLRDHAYAMRGLPVPPNATPDAPLITAIAGKTVTWRGATPADTYTIERSTAGPDGPWTTACTDCSTQDDTTWTDATRPAGAAWYRVQGVNLDGAAGPFSPAFEMK
ncbi:MAG TPA: hypothetical protein VKB76_11380, partial [Ktedonobacterales bacterium]|nr:hypothetical protein [Ktedonobacterales bacterium]